MKKLTENQTWCIEELRRRGMYYIAEVTHYYWVRGKTYYIDKRIDAKGLRRKFEQGNAEALA